MNSLQLYEAIRPSMETGDLVLFSGKGAISGMIKWFQGRRGFGSASQWSHVGMVIRSEDLGAVLLWESTTLAGLEDVETGEASDGVQLVDLRRRVLQYPGAVAWRPLRWEPTAEDWEALRAAREEFRSRPYEASRVELIRAAYDGPLGQNTQDLSSIFCSELVAEMYRRWGLVPNDLPANEYTPADFSSLGEGQVVGPDLLRGARIGLETMIKEEAP